MKSKRKKPEPEKEKAIKTLSAVAEGLGYSLDELVSCESTEEDQLLTIKQVAGLLNVSPFTIRRKIAAGYLKALKLHDANNGSVRIYKSAVLNWLKNCQKDCGGNSNE